MKTLEDFKQQVAEKYGRKCFINTLLNNNLLVIINEAAELYADYKAKEAFARGCAVGRIQSNNEAWNEALHWVIENAIAIHHQDYGTHIVEQSVLKGLKP